MPTAIDWSKKPPPWDEIGPQFASECRLIAAGKPPKVPEFRPIRPQRKHRDAVPPDPQHQEAVAAHQAEVSAVKERLKIEHDLRAAGVTKPRGGARYLADRAG